VGLASEIGMLNRRFSAARLVGHMRRDKKTRDGTLRFVLVRGIGAAFTSGDVAEEVVMELLRAEGCGI
jgi:shikimate kinase / 3-dehydroquinate synthase